MMLNGSGVRDIARVLQVSFTTVIQVLKKLVTLKPVNQKLLQQLKPEEVEELFWVVGVKCILEYFWLKADDGLLSRYSTEFTQRHC